MSAKWVGHSGVTSAQFSRSVSLGLWLLSNIGGVPNVSPNLDTTGSLPT